MEFIKQNTRTSLLEETIFRPATMADLEPAVALFNACSQDQIGADETSVGEYRVEWQSPGFNLADSTRLAVTPDGRIVGCVEVWDTMDPPVKIWVWGRVHPEFEGLGIGTRLMAWAEKRAQKSISRVSDELKVAFQSGTLSTHLPTKRLLEKQGMELIRYFWRMVINLEQDFPKVTWSPKYQLRTFAEVGDIVQVYQAVDDAFKDHWGYVPRSKAESLKQWRHWTENDPDFDPTLWFLLMEREEIVAMSLCRPHEHGDPDMGYINTLGVRRPWRRQGLALSLLQHTFAEFKTRGQERVGLGVDAGSLTGATRLYEKAGMRVDREYHDYTKVIRPGEDISTQTLED